MVYYGMVNSKLPHGYSLEGLMKPVRAIALVGAAALCFSGGFEPLPILGSPAFAASKIVCASADFDYSYCAVPNHGKVELIQQLSQAPCVEGRTWGTDPRGIWVTRGCAAQFRVGSDGNNAGAVVGAVILGGIVGAILGGGNDNSYRSSSSTVHRTGQSDSYSPAYDRYGNPNYGRKGRYQGCHGLGCEVDHPDAGQNQSEQIDTRPQFDRDGNPNFDTHGNYIGCHGSGCDVENPDTPQ